MLVCPGRETTDRKNKNVSNSFFLFPTFDTRRRIAYMFKLGTPIPITAMNILIAVGRMQKIMKILKTIPKDQNQKNRSQIVFYFWPQFLHVNLSDAKWTDKLFRCQNQLNDWIQRIQLMHSTEPTTFFKTHKLHLSSCLCDITLKYFSHRSWMFLEQRRL